MGAAERLLWAGALALEGCLGLPSALHTVHPATGQGTVHLELENKTDAPINNFCLAPSQRLRAAGRRDPEFGATTQPTRGAPISWGRSALPVGGKLIVPVNRPSRYGVRAFDRTGREQHLGSFYLGAGGWYVLVLRDGSWRAPP